MNAVVQQPRCGGFSTCPRPCGECRGSAHHLSDAMMGFAEGEPEHEAAKAGAIAWWGCKHCDSWIECTGEEEDGPDPSIFASLPPPPARMPRRRAPTLLGAAGVLAATICKCGHRADSHYPELPSPCGHGRTMPDAEIIARACDPTVTQDPRYGCHCIAFSRGEPS